MNRTHLIEGCVHIRDQKIEVSPLSRKPKDFLSECGLAAEEIYKSREGTFRLMVSGGIDSVVMSHSFAKLGIPLNATFIEIYWNGERINDYDRTRASHLANTLSFSLDFYRVDLDQFLEDGYRSLRETYKSTFVCFPIYMHVAHKLGGTSVFGCGDIFADFALKRKVNTSEFFFSEYPHWSRIGESLKNTNDALIIPRFYLSTPELLASTLNDPDLKKIMRLCQPTRSLGVKRFKHFFYESKIPGLDPREKKHGLEELPVLSDLVSALRADFAFVNRPVEISLSEVERCLYQFS